MQATQLDVHPLLQNKTKLIESGLLTESSFNIYVESNFDGLDTQELLRFLSYYTTLSQFLSLHNERRMIDMSSRLAQAMTDFDINPENVTKNSAITAPYLIKIARMYCQVRNRYGAFYKPRYDGKIERMLQCAESLL